MDGQRNDFHPSISWESDDPLMIGRQSNPVVDGHWANHTHSGCLINGLHGVGSDQSATANNRPKGRSIFTARPERLI